MSDSAGGTHGSTLATAPATGIVLRGMAWDHPRGFDPLRAVTADFSVRHPGLEFSWAARPLQSFEDTGLAELTADYDVLAIDHPFVGDAAVSGVLLPLDEVLEADVLDRRERDSVGPSQLSYRWDGRHWALAVDAACMVGAASDDAPVLDGPPQIWDEVTEVVKSLGPQRVLLAANPTHLWGTLLCLCESLSATASLPPDRPAWWSADGPDSELTATAIGRLRDLTAMVDQRSFGLDPVAVLAELASDSPAVYSPLVFGYVTYARAENAHPVSFFPAPNGLDAPRGTLTGGVGLAVSAASEHPELAAEFVRTATSAAVQRRRYLDAGGQPARRSAWQSASGPGADRFFGPTLATMERAFLRPRDPGYPAYQRAAAQWLHQALRADESPDRIAAGLRERWRTQVRSR